MIILPSDDTGNEFSDWQSQIPSRATLPEPEIAYVYSNIEPWWAKMAAEARKKWFRANPF